MFTKKKDLEAHIHDVFKKTRTEPERNLKCLTFAKQYAQLKEWALARRYVNAFLKERNNSAQALRLLGDCEEKEGFKEKALNAYRNSLASDGSQRDLVFKVCELLCEVPSNNDVHEYWCERAEQLDNGHPVIFKLKEHMLTLAAEKSDDHTVRKELEELILAEQKARPNDPRPKSRLLKLYLEKGQVEQAFQLATQTEMSAPFRNDVSWYETLCEVFEAYQRRQKVDWEFHTQKLLALDRMVALCLSETVSRPAQFNSPSPQLTKSNATPTSSCIEAIFQLDQALYVAAKTPHPTQSAKRQLTEELERHIAAQLAYHMATLFFRKAKKDTSQWSNAVKFSGPLLVLAYQTRPPEPDLAWLKDLSDVQRNIAKCWISEGEQRCSQAGNVLLGLNKKKRFLDAIAPFMLTKWQDRLFGALFPMYSQKKNTSYFAILCNTNDVVVTLPTPDDLWPLDEATQLRQRHDLNYLVWYGLNFLPYGAPWTAISPTNDDPTLTVVNVVPKHPLCPMFDGLKLHPKDVTMLVPASLESLCQLDLDAFVYATVICASGVLEEQQRRWSDERPALLPTSITESLCTSNQIHWWSSVCWLLQPNSGNKSIDPEGRRKVKLGLETIRAVESQSGHQDVRLLCALARFFSGQAVQAEQSKRPKELTAALHARAFHYWACAKPALERIKADRASRSHPSDRMFDLPGKELDQHSAESLLYEASFSAACHLVRAGQIEEAIEAFGELSSPYASMQQALLYKELADKEESNDTLKKALLTRTRDSLYVTLDRLRAPKVDPRHPLNVELRDHIEEVEDRINTLFPKCNKPPGARRIGVLSDTSSEEENEEFQPYPMRSMPSYSTPASTNRNRSSRDTRTFNGTPTNGVRSHTSFHGGARDVLDTSRPREEARPSPERLEAQIRHIMLQMLQREREVQTMAHLLETSRAEDKGLKDELHEMQRKMEETQKEVQEMRRENQELHKNVKDIQNDVQKIVKAIVANNLQNASPGVSEAHNIPDEELYLYGEDELENEYSTADLAAAAAHLGAPYPQQTAQSLASASHRASQPAHAAAAAAAAATAAAFHALPPGFPFRPPGFFPLTRPVDSALTMYQSLGCFGQGALPFSEGQRLPDFQLAPPMLPPQAPVLPPAGLPPPQSVFSRLGAMMAPGYEQTDLGSTAPIPTEDMRVPPVQRPVQPPVAMPPQASAAGVTPVSTQDAAAAEAMLNSYLQAPHAYQISMPPQAQILTESPLEKAPNLGDQLVISPKSILQSVPPPEFSSVSPDKHRNQSGSARRAQRLSTGSGVGSEDGEDLPEHDPCPDFQPLIPLPDEVVPTTGEEGETVMFESRAKLYRYVDNEWKERGVGLLKILESPITGKARILMRRDQVLKVCCNHFVPADLSLSRIAGNDKTWSWAAPDFADGEMQLEKLGVRFKTAEQADLFKEAMEKAKEAANRPSVATVVAAASSSTSAAAPSTPQTKSNVAPSTPASSTSTVSLGGFTFTTPPTIVKQATVDTPVSTKTKEVDIAKPSPFSNFTFGKAAAVSTPPVFGATTTGTLFGANANQGKPQSIETTKVFDSSPLTQISFASIAKQTPQSFQPSQGFKGFDGTGSKVFSSSPATPSSTVTSASVATPTSPEEGHIEDFVPTAEFQPVVPLPELVDVKTGEEGEEILFEKRAKLLRFDSNLREWKERGIGKMKITWDPSTGKVRLIMRREQVLKVCCNHFLTSDIVLQDLATSDRSWCWYAKDYSDGSLESELFAIKFKTRDEALSFKEKWTEIQNEMTDNKYRLSKDVKPIQVQPTAQKPLSELFKPKTGTWECTSCYTRNEADKMKCVACNGAKPGAAAAVAVTSTAPATQTSDSLMSKFKPAAGSWECPGCCTRNQAENLKCVCCETPKPGAAVAKSPQALTSGTTSAPGLGLTFGGKPGSSQFSFGMPKDTPVTTTATFGTGQATSFMFGNAQSQTSVTAPPATSFTFGNAQQTSTPNTSFSFGVAKPADTSATPTSFGFATTQPSSTPAAFSFGTAPATIPATLAEQEKTVASAFTFGSPHKFQFNFKASQQTSPPKGGLSPRSPRTSIGSAGSPGTPGQGEDSDDEVDHDDGEHIHFAPVIPLPEVVPVVTGEESEDVLYCQRAKLYRFIDGEWKERGIGDFKILRHRENKTIRFLMRRDQVLKICLNHRLSVDLPIEPKDKDDRSFVWSASDFSEEEIHYEQFALRFKTAEIAAKFIAAVGRAKAELSGAPIDDSTSSPVITPIKNESMVAQVGTPFTVSRLDQADQNETVTSTIAESPAMSSFSFAQATPASQQSFSLGGLFGSPQASPQDLVRRNIFGGQATPKDAGTPATYKSEDQKSDGGDEVEIVSVQLATPEEVEKARRLQLPDNFYLYRLRPECAGCRGCRDTEALPVTPVTQSQQKKEPVAVTPAIQSQQQKKEAATPAFSGPAQFATSLVSSQIKPLVNGKSEKPAGEQPIAFLPTDDKISFASLANQSNTGFAGIQSTPTTSFSWAGAGTPVFGGGKIQPVFGSATKDTPTKSDKEGESSGDEGGEDETHDPHFEPIVALPDAIEVKTGEEEEEKLFSQRAKLYRYSSDLKEWKERGVGEIKILHHKENGTYRLLMRREQVHKLVLNQLLTPANTLSRMATNSNAWCWAGINYAEDEAKLEELAVRFKNEDIMKEFHDRFEECKTALLAKQSQVPQPTLAEAAVAQPGETPAEEAAAGAAAATTSEEEEEEEDYETYDEDEDDDEDEEASVVFEKRVTLTTRGPTDPDNEWQTLGQGTLRMVHSGHLCSMRVHVEADDSGELLCNVPIDTEAKVEQQDKDCTFSGLDEILPNPVQRHFKAKFSSSQAAEEFKINFMEGLSLAEQAEMYGDEEEEDDEDGEE